MYAVLVHVSARSARCPAIFRTTHLHSCLTLSHLPLCVQEDEMPSDFQDYSLVTLVGVAAHLMHVSGSPCCRNGTNTLCPVA
jgi:hypothetical protein